MPDRENVKYCGTLGEFFAMTSHMPRNTPIYAASNGKGITLHVGQPERESAGAEGKNREVLEACS